ncbi:MAG: peptide ABC transporter substrate-binding protein, partial [Paracoccaceae bacterium]
RFNELLIAARAELDTDKRREMYYEMQQIVSKEGGVIVPMYANWVDAASTKLAHNDTIGNMWPMDGTRLIERWWFA